MSSQLQLVPETILKRKHDLDERKAHRASQAILNPRGNKRVFNSKTKVMKIHKPESILAKARQSKHHAIRYRRVQKKGMQKRASDTQTLKKKQFFPEGTADEVLQQSRVRIGKDDQDDFMKEVDIANNSVGAKVVFVVRIRNKEGMPKEVQRVLNRLRLRGMNQGTFCRYDVSTRKQLHLIEPWVTYGILSKSMISDLIHRRGHAKIYPESKEESTKNEGKDVDGKEKTNTKKSMNNKPERIPLSDNTIVEKAFGAQTDNEVICVEDIVHELYTVGENFHKVNSFLWPFALSSAHSKFQKEKLNYQNGGDYGDRGEEMDDLLRTML